MPIHQSDPDRAPDADFEPGAVRHLVPGNHGRMLDWRRTPISVVALEVDAGFMVLRIEGFEDAGAVWRIPFEEVGHYQFARGSATADPADVAIYERTIERLLVPLAIEPDPARRAETEAAITVTQDEAADWLETYSRFLAARRPLPPPDERRSDELLLADSDRYFDQLGLTDVESALAQAYVSNPYAGELVKGHAVVLDEVGLASFRGTVARDPATFEGAWTRERRRRHILARLGFVRALLRLLPLGHPTLWRGVAAGDGLDPDRLRTFTSTSLSRAVAQSLVDAGGSDAEARLVGQPLPVDRVFMSYLETRAMNAQYLEAEVVLLASRDDGWV